MLGTQSPSRACLPRTQQRVGTLLSETSYGTDDELWDLLERVGIVNAGWVSASAACGW